MYVYMYSRVNPLAHPRLGCLTRGGGGEGVGRDGRAGGEGGALQKEYRYIDR